MRERRRRCPALWAQAARLAVAAAGCGRLGFETEAQGDGGVTPGRDGSLVVGDAGYLDASLFQDEDDDGIPDQDDRCPHRADPGQEDSDGDGVGDACDPRPDVPGESIVFFTSFDSWGDGWLATYGGPGIPDETSGGSYYADTRGGTYVQLLYWPETAEWDRAEIGVRIGEADPSDRRVALRVTGTNSYECGLFDPGGAPQVRAVAVDQSQSAQLHQGFAQSSGFVQLDFSQETLGCQPSWAGSDRLEMPYVDTLDAYDYEIEFGGVELWLDYFVVIRSE